MNRLTLLTLILLCGTRISGAADQVYDVVVYGGTSAGVAAALQVRRMGKTVALLEPGKHLGGLTSGGLGWTDSGDKAVIGGISREFYQRVKQYYDQPDSWLYEKPEQYDRYRPGEDAMWTFEPHVAEMIYEQLLAEHEIQAVLNQSLDRDQGVQLDGRRIATIRVTSGEIYRGQMFIDATYEGDLMAAAGVSYAVGRESNQQYGESLNGVQVKQNIHKHRFVRRVDPYLVPGDPTSGLLPGLHGGEPGEQGQADHRVQAYCFRLCMSNVPQNRAPFPKPRDYDERRYELLLRNFEAGDLRLPLKLDMMPNGKTDTNNNCAFSTDNIGMNYDYPEAGYERRQEILRDHQIYQQGLMWTLANHPRVPAEIRREMAGWGLAKDEFADNGNWPHQLYVREARRMVGDYVVTEHDCRRVRIAEDPVGMGSYNMDSHNVQRYIASDGGVQNEGDVQVSPGGSYLVSYQATIPKRGEAENLLVPVCLSASHIAYGSIRMEPVFMILGQSTATAAVQAIEGRVAVQDLSYSGLRARLLADGQVLTWAGTPPPSRFTLDPAQLPGIVLDDDAMEQIGGWLPSTSVSGFVGTRYWHDSHESQGTKSIRFRIKLKTPGRYEVRLAYTPNANRATNVPVTVRHVEGDTTIRVNQRLSPPIDKAFISLGTFTFAGRERQEVVISNQGTDGHVVADAIQLIPAVGTPR